MSRRAAFSVAEVSRLVRGAIRGGMPVGSFKVVVENGHPELVPINGNEPLPSPTDDGWDEALIKWRSSV
jgi:hypothetical protein